MHLLGACCSLRTVLDFGNREIKHHFGLNYESSQLGEEILVLTGEEIYNQQVSCSCAVN